MPLGEVHTVAAAEVWEAGIVEQVDIVAEVLVVGSQDIAEAVAVVEVVFQPSAVVEQSALRPVQALSSRRDS